MRGPRAVAITVGLFALLGTTSLRAQEPATPRTHTVKRGDTLWDLARLYLGDPFLWPEIYRLNTDVIDDPHWIYPGEILKLPGRGATPTVAQAPTPPTARPGATPAGAAQPTPPAAAPKPVIEAPPLEFSGPTVFPKPFTTGPQIRERVSVQPPPPVVRIGEFLAAPFVERKGGPRGAGAIIKAISLSNTLSGQDFKSRLQLHDEVLINPPAGSAAPDGERYVSYVNGPYLEDLGQIVIPTGIVRVTRAPREGEAAIAQVVRMFGEMRPDQQLMPYDSTSLAVTGQPQAVTNSDWSAVKFVLGDAVLPTTQSYLVLDISSRDGIKVGDEFMFFEKRQESDSPGGLAQPEIAIARGQVVRVTPYATTILVTTTKYPKIEAGTLARRVAAMP